MSTYSTFEQLYPFIREAMEEYHLAQGLDISQDWFLSSLKINTEQVHDKCKNFMVGLANLAEVESLEGLKVLDSGMGFGTMMINLVLEQRPNHMAGFDVNSGFVKHVANLLGKIKLDSKVDLAVANMKSLPSGPQMFDLIICYNAILYFPDNRDFQRTLKSFYRSLKPGGSVVIYYPNKWHPFEQFTRIPGLNYLPQKLADFIVRLTKRRSGYTDVRMRSPREFEVCMNEIGFHSIRHGRPNEYKKMKPLDWIASYLMVAAKK